MYFSMQNFFVHMSMVQKTAFLQLFQLSAKFYFLVSNINRDTNVAKLRLRIPEMNQASRSFPIRESLVYVKLEAPVDNI